MIHIMLLLIAAGTAGLPTPYLVSLYVLSAVWLICRELGRRRSLDALPSAFSKALLAVIEQLEENSQKK